MRPGQGPVRHTPAALRLVSRLPVTIFADFTCPYSYISEAVLWRMPATDIELRFRAFELFPEPSDLPPRDYGAEEWSRIADLARDAGITIHQRLDRSRTAKAHEASVFARERGRETEFRSVIYESYWDRGEDIARIDVLTAIADGVGLDGEEMRIALDIDRHHQSVRDDTELAGRLRIPGTPAIFLGTGPSARIIVGAHPGGELRTFVNDALRSRTEEG